MTAEARTVLLVEDNPDDEEMTIRELARANPKNRVDVSRDGQEAIDYLFGTEQHAARPLPAVALLDLKLPKVDGLEASSASAQRSGPTDCRWSSSQAQTRTPI